MPLDRSWMNLDILDKDILLCNSHNLSSNSLPNLYTFTEQNHIPSSVVASQHCCMQYGKFAFIKRTDKGGINTVNDLESWCQPRSQGPTLPVPWSERERKTLENARHVSPRIWEITKHNIEGGAGKSGVLVRICQALPLCYILSSSRFWETRNQRFPGSFSPSRSKGREGEDPGNEVELMLRALGLFRALTKG